MSSSSASYESINLPKTDPLISTCQIMSTGHLCIMGRLCHPEPQTEDTWTLPKANGFGKDLASIKDIQIEEITIWEINIYQSCFTEKKNHSLSYSICMLWFFIFTAIFFHPYFCFNVTLNCVIIKLWLLLLSSLVTPWRSSITGCNLFMIWLENTFEFWLSLHTFSLRCQPTPFNTEPLSWNIWIYQYLNSTTYWHFIWIAEH